MTSQSQPQTPVRVPKVATTYTPTTQDPDLRSQINTVLLRDGHVEKYIPLPHNVPHPPQLPQTNPIPLSATAATHLSTHLQPNSANTQQNPICAPPRPPRPPHQLALQSLPPRPLPPAIRGMHHFPKTPRARARRHSTRY